MMGRVETEVRRTEDLRAEHLVEIRAVMDDAFVDDPLTEDDWDHCLGGLHVLTRDGDLLVAHAAIVARPMLLDGTAHTVGYVEGVGVRRSHLRRGLGGTVLAPIESMAGGEYEVLALATSDEGLPFYLARGWRPWPGRTYVVTPTGRRRTPDEDDSVMVWPTGAFAAVGPDSELACYERSGEDW
jgi:aminoglycoside 2'-N-acetyltransferase I